MSTENRINQPLQISNQPRHRNEAMVVTYNKRRFQRADEIQLDRTTENATVQEEQAPDDCDGVAIGLTFITWISAVLVLFYMSASAVTSVGSGLLSLLGVILIFTGIAMFLLLFKTNDSSISAMVAQRWNPVSYIAIIMIVSFGLSVASLLICISVVQQSNGHFQILKSVAMPLSIFLCLMILMVPLPVDKFPYQLMMKPLSDCEVSLNALDIELADGTKVQEHAYRLKFFNAPTSILRVLHYIMVGVGYLIGAVSEIVQIVLYFSDDLQYAVTVLTIIYMSWAAINAFLFFFGSRCGFNSYALYSSEATFLLAHFTSMILFLVNDEGLVEVDLSK